MKTTGEASLTSIKKSALGWVRFTHSLSGSTTFEQLVHVIGSVFYKKKRTI